MLLWNLVLKRDKDEDGVKIGDNIEFDNIMPLENNNKDNGI